MGTITRSFANNITTSGVVLPASLTNNSIANVTSYNAAVATGGMVLISSQTASASASISFTSGIDSTYKEYQFYFINCHPAVNLDYFGFQGSTNGGSSYGITTTSTHFFAGHEEDDSWTGLAYASSYDLAQSASDIPIGANVKNDNDIGISGMLSLYNPSSTTYVKHFISSTNHVGTDENTNSYVAGYLNTTTAINAVKFNFSSGNIDDGTILMYGIV